MTIDDVQTYLIAIDVILVLFLIGWVLTRRVRIAWLVYFSLRRKPEFQSPEARAWLWQKTLDRANGKHTDADR
jgi:hypothetical protein